MRQTQPCDVLSAVDRRQNWHDDCAKMNESGAAQSKMGLRENTGT